MIFPELVVCGYPPRDLLTQAGFVDRNLDQLARVAALSTAAAIESTISEPGTLAIGSHIAADLYARAAGWSQASLLDPAARVDLPDIGEIGMLSDCYRDTPLSRA